ncbi:alpha/beta hydrolase [Pseudomonas sp. N040]|uniref:alpha/beta hydrolase n=1 Tax=Pseudomonas sp. N040 TaxID=2785325 RepID=UPI0018A2581B|nr:alpha/beta hydrolase [Pseudomonas sp. N040]MBF7729254.1 alpha/beta hydrolase [Pseudomonas sp. N040]MBW7012894.1 alpha/beta hydrolase [Pseudomonas sp. N040]
MMQSWQTDLLNLQLSLSVKPLFRFLGSVDRVRSMVKVMDLTVGRLAIPGGTVRRKVNIPGAPFEAEWVCHDDKPKRRVILYLPGGAYILRMPNTHTGMVSRLCRLADAKALMAYYRLAPEHPFPACLDDALLAYKWLLRKGYAAEQIVIAGDSAGGGLTLSLLLAIRDARLPTPACAYMLSPLLDVSDSAASRWKNAASDKALPAAHQRAINPRVLYVGDYAIDDPGVSPLFGDYHDLPPLYVQVSDSEMLLDDSLRMARRGHTYQVEVKVDIWRKVPHVWQAFAFLPESHDALGKAADFIRQKIPVKFAKRHKVNLRESA